MKKSNKSGNDFAKTPDVENQVEFIPCQISHPHKLTHNTQIFFKKIIDQIHESKRLSSLPSNYLSLYQALHRGRIVCREEDCFQLAVTEALINRAILILDTLAKELEKRKFKIQSVQGKDGWIVVAVKDGESINFRISEGYRYHPKRKDTKTLSKLELLLYPDKEPLGTGILTLSAMALKSNVDKKWTDGRRLIEDDLLGISHEFDSLLMRHKQHLMDLVIRDEKRREELLIYQEIERTKNLEKAIYEKAFQEAQSFKAYTELDNYLNLIEEKYLNHFGKLNQSAKFWLDTARKIAQTNNLVGKRLKILSQD
jgi:hypothetical protein